MPSIARSARSEVAGAAHPGSRLPLAPGGAVMEQAYSGGGVVLREEHFDAGMVRKRRNLLLTEKPSISEELLHSERLGMPFFLSFNIEYTFF